MAEAKLKPCPFCEAKESEDKLGKLIVHDKDCLFAVWGVDIPYRTDRWNTRPIEDRLLEACKELLLYISVDNELKVTMYPESIDFAKQTITKAERKQ